jgi:hypothetical protein
MKATNYRQRSPRRSSATIDSLLARTLALAMLGLGGAGCVEDAEVCDAHQVHKIGGTILEYTVCVCDEAAGYVFDEPRGYGCKRCTEGQTIVAGKCTAPNSDAGAEQTDGSSTSEPTGVGEYCDTDADCAAFDAKYCAVPTHSCLVESCATGEHTCSSTAACCDYSALLAGFSLCLPPEQLTDGACPMGGMKVEP